MRKAIQLKTDKVRRRERDRATIKLYYNSRETYMYSFELLTLNAQNHSVLCCCRKIRSLSAYRPARGFSLPFGVHCALYIERERGLKKPWAPAPASRTSSLLLFLHAAAAFMCITSVLYLFNLSSCAYVPCAFSLEYVCSKSHALIRVLTNRERERWRPASCNYTEWKSMIAERYV